MGYTNYPNGLTSFGVPLYGGGGGCSPIGIGMGDLKYVVDSKSSNQWYTSLKKKGIADVDIFTTIQDAHDACTEGQNDVVFCTRGTYDTAAAAGDITWSKSYTHLIGPSNGRPQIRSLHTSGVAVILCTAHHCKFHNLDIKQYGEASTCIAGFKEQGYANEFVNCKIRGDLRTEQAQNANCCSLFIDTSVSNAGLEDAFYSCRIGSMHGIVRTLGAVILIGLTNTGGNAKEMLFDRCWIESRSVTAGCTAVTISANSCIAGLTYFKDCLFNNYYAGGTFTALTECIDDNCNTDHTIVIDNCVNVGFAAWDSGNTHVRVAMPDVNTAGGIAEQAA